MNATYRTVSLLLIFSQFLRSGCIVKFLTICNNLFKILMQVQVRMQLTGKDYLLAMIKNYKKEVGKGREYWALLANLSQELDCPERHVFRTPMYMILILILNFFFFLTFNLISDYLTKRKDQNKPSVTLLNVCVICVTKGAFCVPSSLISFYVISFLST